MHLNEDVLHMLRNQGRSCHPRIFMDDFRPICNNKMKYEKMQLKGLSIGYVSADSSRHDMRLSRI